MKLVNTFIIPITLALASAAAAQTIDKKTMTLEAAKKVIAATVADGEARRIVKGDVIVIPQGTPHWFKEVNGPVNYYVVKVRSAN